MENEPKKISFGFSKFSKKSNLIIKPQPTVEKQVEIIEYLEEKSIKIVGGDDKPKGPLVIPMKQPNKKLINLIDIVENNFDEKPPESDTNDSTKTNLQQKLKDAENLTLEELATKELLNDSKAIKIKEEIKRVIDVSENTDKVTFEGEKESTLDDYEEIPIEEFGKAMLRGMGWKDGHGIGKNEQLVKMSQPIQRPKGMGLGADKLTKQDKTEKPAVDRDGNVLKCVKGAYVKIIAGYHKGNYGQIMGLDDESGRFIIKTALNNLNVSLNEFLVVPVTKQDYMKNSKVINNAKYEEYVQKKELEERKKQEKVKIKKEASDESDEDRDVESNRKKYIKKEPQSSDSDRSRDRTEKYDKRRVKKERNSSESDYEDKYRKEKYETNYKREESVKKNREKHKSKSKRYSDDSDSETEKKKTKKKSSKYESDEEKKKHKKKKSKKYSSDDDSDENYKRKSRKSDRKKYDSDSDNERYNKKKKDKYREKRDKSRYDRK